MNSNSKSRSDKIRKSEFSNPEAKKPKQDDTTPPTTPSHMTNYFNANFGDSPAQTFTPNNYSNTGNTNNKNKNNKNKDNHNHKNHHNNHHNNNDRTISHENEDNDIDLIAAKQNEIKEEKEKEKEEDIDVKENKHVQVEDKNYGIRLLENVYNLLVNMMNENNYENNDENNDNGAPISPILISLLNEYPNNLFVKSGVVEKRVAEYLFSSFESVFLQMQDDLKELDNIHEKYEAMQQVNMSGGYDNHNNNHNNNNIYNQNLMTGSFIGNNNNIAIDTNNDIISITFDDCYCAWSSLDIPSYSLNYNIVSLFPPAGDCLKFDQKTMTLYSLGDTIRDTFLIISTLALRKVKIVFFDKN